MSDAGPARVRSTSSPGPPAPSPRGLAAAPCASRSAPGGSRPSVERVCIGKVGVDLRDVDPRAQFGHARRRGKPAPDPRPNMHRQIGIGDLKVDGTPPQRQPGARVDHLQPRRPGPDHQAPYMGDGRRQFDRFRGDHRGLRPLLGKHGLHHLQRRSASVPPVPSAGPQRQTEPDRHQAEDHGTDEPPVMGDRSRRRVEKPSHRAVRPRLDGKHPRRTTRGPALIHRAQALEDQPLERAGDRLRPFLKRVVRIEPDLTSNKAMRAAVPV